MINCKQGIYELKGVFFTDNQLVKIFWSCGDRVLIDFATEKVGLNREEKEVLHLLLDDCRSQEKAAEIMDISRTKVQVYWNNACKKLLNQEWLRIYADVLEHRQE